MPRKKRTVVVPLETIWEIPDAAWERLENILLERYPPAATGRPRSDWRRAINGIIFHLRTGCQWNRLPKVYGDDSTVHRWWQRWVGDEVFRELWAVLLAACDELGGVNWQWQAADGCMNKARFGGAKQAQTPRIGANQVPRRASLSRPTEALSV